jgi:hypothetical protein
MDLDLHLTSIKEQIYQKKAAAWTTAFQLDIE